MSVKLFNEPGRVVKNERGAYLWKVGTGYRMSRMAKELLNIKADEGSKLGIGYDETLGKPIIRKSVEDMVSNCSVSKLNTIANTGVVMKLATFGNKFEITRELDSDGFNIMNVIDELGDTEISTIQDIKEPISDEKLSELLEEQELSEKDTF